MGKLNPQFNLPAILMIEKQQPSATIEVMRPFWFGKFLDLICLLMGTVFLTGGYLWYSESGQIIIEIADLAPFGILLAIFYVQAIFNPTLWPQYLENSAICRVSERIFSKIKSQPQANWNCILFCSLIGYGTFLFVLNLIRHFSLNTGFDTAIFDQAIYNSSIGHFHFSQIKGDRSLFSDHFQPILLLFVPLYYFWASPVWLFIGQSFTLFFSGVAIVKICRFYLLGRAWEVLLLISLVSLQLYRGVLLNDFHPISFIVPIFLFLFLAIVREDIWQIIILAGLALLCKEHVGIYLFAFGIYAPLSITTKRRIPVALSLIAMGAIHFVVVTKILMPFFGQIYSYQDRYAYLGHDWTSVLFSLINPAAIFPVIFTYEKIKYLLFLFGPVLFLPLFASKELILFVPFLAQNLLSTFNSQHGITGTHYSAEGIAILFFAVIKGVVALNNKKLPRSESNQLKLKALFVIATILFYGRSESLDLRKNLVELNRYQLILNAYEKIPKNASISVQNSFLPHFTHRQPAYLYPHKEKTDVIFVSQNFKPWPISPKEFEQLIKSNSQYAQSSLVLDRQTFLFFNATKR